MKQQLVYDLPTRFFHWLFAGFFLLAFIIAKTVDDESAQFSYHMMAGLTLSFLIVLRLIWGFLGTRHARFSGFALSPKDLPLYFKGILSGDKRRWVGHNPASSWTAIIMMVLGLGLGVTGFLMTSGPSQETYEDLHEILANTFIVLVGLHICGIILHTLRHKEIIALSMLHGKKENVAADQVLASSKPAFGLLLLALVVGFNIYLSKNYDLQSRKLQLFGTTLKLSKPDKDEKSHEGAGDEKKLKPASDQENRVED